MKTSIAVTDSDGHGACQGHHLIRKMMVNCTDELMVMTNGSNCEDDVISMKMIGG